jgi:predicted nicotinamide N-methyase
MALELGSGTGLVGMALAAVWGASVLLSDLPEIEGNLVHNVEQNLAVIQKHGGNAATAVLDWSKPTDIIPSVSTGQDDKSDAKQFPVIVAADSVYSAEHPAMLVSAIETWLAKGPNARVVMEMPRRDCYGEELTDLRIRMLDLGLQILNEGEEVGYDDWGGDTLDEVAEVKCWWSVWGWKTE